MNENRVDLLCPGMIRRDGAIILEARSSATLFSRGEKHILVDTSGTENRQVLLQALASLGLRAQDIEAVVLTHLHQDHDGNLDLFPAARRIVHRLEGSNGEEFDDRSELWQGVGLMHTPGHTKGSMSVLVDAGEVYAIVGDAIPSEDNVSKWVPPGVHCDRAAAMASMTMLIDMADVIVPGHGPPFRTAKHRNKGR